MHTYILYILFLAEIEQMMKYNAWLHNHYSFVVKEMKIKAYSQLLVSYRSVTLESIAAAFGVSQDYIDR